VAPADRSAARSWPALLSALIAGGSLSVDDTAWAMDEIMGGNASPARLASFAVLLRAKGETPEELAGLVRTMLDRAAPVPVSRRAVDLVGTGGDLAHTVNITTMAALVVAGAGRPIVKHGNRSASSLCGSADVLEELGVAIDLPADGVAATVAEVGIGFCFAPVFHSGMRHAGPTRGELGVPTFFNFLGPLTNPARVTSAAIGCSDARMAPVMAAVLAGRGDTALVFRGDDGLDELTTTTTSRVWIASGGLVSETTLDPAEFGITPVPPEALRGGDRVQNAAVVREVLAGGAPAIREAVLLNAAAAIAAFDAAGDGAPDAAAGAGLRASTSGGPDAAASGIPDAAAAGARGLRAESLHDAIAAGLRVAAESIDSGAARDLLQRWVASSQRARG
jgi:anthranilate phosphoribosyltransferase